ncbi:MAG: Mrp/NBP35 family ATP-binding protein [Burkholderiales bacterium]|nr:Mrp/NBP35 family ATP-binding protein [Burkholderiales bacterium]
MNQNSIIAHRVKQGLKRITNIKNIIAITSGKGGVGKSTTAINFAVSLAKQGLNVGILDADIYGPSLPKLIGAEDYKPEVSPSNKFMPLDKYGVKTMSFGFLVDSSQATIWRGAIVNKALEQMLNDTEWGELDVLVIDMPPGTGDIHLTIGQKFPITATIVVTTPQDIALIDVGKSIGMFEKLAIPCIGIVENMAVHTCINCGHSEEIFGHGAKDKLKQKYNLDLLGQLPLDANICTQSDNGTPIVLNNENIANIYNNIAKLSLDKLAELPKDYSTLIPEVKKI